MRTKVKINNYSAKYVIEENLKLEMAKVHLEKVLNSNEFKAKVLNFTYRGKKAFIDNNGFDNAEILKILLDGSEILNKKIDHTWQFFIKIINRPWYKRWSKANAYTYSNTLEISIYRDSFDSYSIEQLAGLLAHEQCHNLGFDHDFNATMKRPHSVPYAIGRIVRECIYSAGVEYVS